MFKLNFFKKKKQKTSNKQYVNKVTFNDADNNEISVEIKTYSDNRSILLIKNEKRRQEISLQPDGALFLNALLSDFVENGNLNKIEDILTQKDDNNE